MKIVIVLSGLLVLLHCAGGPRGVEKDHPLYQKTIGIFFDLSAKGNFKGVDHYDLKVYLRALEKNLNINAPGVRFKLIASGLPGDTRYQRFHERVKPGFSGKKLPFGVSVPEKTAFAKMNHQIDYLLILDMVDFEGNIEVTQYREYVDPATDSRVTLEEGRKKLKGRGTVEVIIGNARPLLVTVRDGGEKLLDPGTIIHARRLRVPTNEQAVTLKYLFWDYAANSSRAFDFPSIERKGGFGESGETLEEAAAKMAREVLRNIL